MCGRGEFEIPELQTNPRLFISNHAKFYYVEAQNKQFLLNEKQYSP